MSSQDQHQKTIDEQAADWLVRMSAPDILDEDILSLTDWLEQSEAHAHAYDRAEQVWLAADSLMAAPIKSDAQLIDFNAYKRPKLPIHMPTRSQPRRLTWLAFGALAAGLAGLALLPRMLLPPLKPVTYVTNKGESRKLVLADGTQLNLNSDTRITVRMDATSREVSLDQGELALDVRHDETRPFTVIAGTTQLRDIGTEFNVLRTAGLTVVTVKSGSVAILPINLKSRSDLTAGDQAIIRDKDGQVQQAKVDPTTAYAWQNHQAIYQDQPLSLVVADLNRYFKKPLVVDGVTGQLRVTAVINLDSEASVVRRLQAFLPIEATAHDDAITLRKSVSWALAWALIGVPAPVLASDQTYSFNVPSQDMRSAVVSVAKTAQISVGGVDPRLCATRSSPLSGYASALFALNTVLSHSGCVAQAVDKTTYVLLRRPERRKIAQGLFAPPPAATPEVIVTANRRSQLAGDAASAISVISSNTVGRSDEGLGSIANRVPGMTLTNLGSGRDKILLRGISDGVFTGRTQSTVGLYLDDTPITFNAPDPDLLLADIDHIEVLRGPQGALYGEGSISGVVSLISHKPDLVHVSERFDASYGLTPGGAPSSRLEAMVNLPVVLDRLGVRLVAYNDQSGGYIDDVALGRTDTNTVHRYGGRLSALWQIEDNWSATLRYASQEINAKNSHYVSGTLGAYSRAVALAEPHDNDFSNLSLSLDGQTKLGRVHVSVNHLHHHIQSRYDASAQATDLATALGAPNSGSLAYDESQRVELQTADMTLTSRADRRLRWLIGAFSSNSSEDFLPTLVDATTSFPLYRETRRDLINSLAIYGEGSFDLTPRLTVTAGLRGTSASHDVRSERATYGAFEIDDGQMARIRNQHLSHQLVLRYRPSAALMVYAQSAEGYRDAGFNTTRLATSPSVPQIYAGDELNSYEAGVKLNLPVQRLRVNAALFRVLWRDIQSDQLQTSGLPLSVNIGNGEKHGA